MERLIIDTHMASKIKSKQDTKAIRDLEVQVLELIGEIHGAREATAYTDEMRDGLAQVYAIPGFRQYLENKILQATKRAAFSKDYDELIRSQSRLIAYGKVWGDCRTQYQHFESKKRKVEDTETKP